jgi:enamine deaminase RidA (YjgF/YER057c/UK114 family)
MSDQPDDRRGFLGMTLLGVTAGTLAGSASSTSGAEQAQAGAGPKGLFPQGAPAAARGYSPGVSAEGQRLIFVSGQGPADMKADMETQIRQTMERIGLVLKEGGASWRDVVMVRSYFTDIARDLPIFRKVRTEFYQQPYPASTAVGVTALATPDLHVEIEAIAVVSTMVQKL